MASHSFSTARDFVSFGNTFFAHAAQAVRVLREQVDAARERVHIVLQLCFLPRLHGLQRFHAAVAHMQLLQRLVLPLHRDLGRPGLVAFVHQHADEVRLIQLCRDDDLLPFPDAGADRSDQARIAAQGCFFHVIHLLVCAPADRP